MTPKTILYAAMVTILLLTQKAVAQNTERTLFAFDGDESVKQWNIVNDGVMGGLSEGKFEITDSKTLRFHGMLSLENNGGFTSVRSRPKKLELATGNFLVIRVQGDGRKYNLNLYEPNNRTAFSYQAPFKTKAGEWIEVRLPLRDFFATSYGQQVDNELQPSRINSIGFLLADKKAGPFELKVQWIKAATPESPD